MSTGERFLWYLSPPGTPPIVVGIADVPAPDGQTLVRSHDIGNGALAQAGAATSQTASAVAEAAHAALSLRTLLDHLPLP